MINLLDLVSPRRLYLILERIAKCFSFPFKQTIESWDVTEDSKLILEYFESTVQSHAKAYTEYWNLNALYTAWSMKKVARWMVKKLENVEPEEVWKNFER